VISGRRVLGVAGSAVGAPAPALPGVWGDAGMAHCGVDGEADIGTTHQVQGSGIHFGKKKIRS
jgi:hypothetical protein